MNDAKAYNPNDSTQFDPNSVIHESDLTDKETNIGRDLILSKKCLNNAKDLIIKALNQIDQFEDAVKNNNDITYIDAQDNYLDEIAEIIDDAKHQLYLI